MLTPPVLEGDHVRLEHLGHEHAAGLAEAAAVDRSTYRFTWVPDGPAEMEEYIGTARAEWEAGRCIAFAVIDRASGRAVGSTRISDLAVLPGDATPSDAHPPTVSEIGYTWYAHSSQRTLTNTETKLLLLTHLFETWPGLRVTLKTDARNQRSRTAIERIGARFEGIRRQHVTAPDGTVRDSAYFSLLADEWPDARENLRERLA